MSQAAYAACPVDQSRLDEATRQRIDDTLDSIETSGAVPGAAIVAVLDGTAIVCIVFGYANLEHEVEITTDSVFDMGSVSKQFTALAILLLEQDGKLDLDDPVQDHLEWFPDFGHTIRIHHLLHHTSGLKDISSQLVLTGRSYLDAYWPGNARNLLERQRTLNHKPGEEYSYTNMGYFVLAQIVEKITGDSLQRFLDECVFEDLGMHTAVFRSSPMQLLRNRVQSYRIRNDKFTPFPSNSGIVGPGFLHLSARDMQTWAAQFGNPESPVAGLLQRMTTTRKLNDGSDNAYAHGLHLETYRGMPAVVHAGRWLGNTSYQQYLSEQQLTILIASNNLLIKPIDVTHGLTDAILDLNDAAKDPMPMEMELLESELDAFTGLYETAHGDFKELLVRDGQLGLLALPDRHFHPLVAIGNTRFRVPDTLRVEVEFVLDDTGRATHYRVHVEDSPPLIRNRVDRADPDQDILAEYEGRYFSDELETLYTIRFKDNGLVASSVAFGDIKLKPASKDNFTGVFWFPTVRFLRDEKDAVTGFNVTANRIRHAYFRKIDW
jgi:CubicO group peptidase (beta-lactamase class C family)